MYAVEAGNVKSVNVMIENKANLEAEDEVGTGMTRGQFVPREIF